MTFEQLQQEFPLERIVNHLRDTSEDSWCTVTYKTKTQNCVFGHIFDLGEQSHQGSLLWDMFEELYATTWMIVPANDGLDPRYQQATPKQRVMAYLDDMISGKNPTTPQAVELSENR